MYDFFIIFTSTAKKMQQLFENETVHHDASSAENMLLRGITTKDYHRKKLLPAKVKNDKILIN